MFVYNIVHKLKTRVKAYDLYSTNAYNTELGVASAQHAYVIC